VAMDFTVEALNFPDANAFVGFCHNLLPGPSSGASRKNQAPGAYTRPLFSST
jgi:hypothetical protein